MIRYVLDPVRLGWDTLRVTGLAVGEATWTMEPESGDADTVPDPTLCLPPGVTPGWLAMKAYWKDEVSTVH